MINKEIRDAAKNKGMALWQVADAIGITPENFSRKMRKELPEEEKARIISIIESSQGHRNTRHDKNGWNYTEDALPRLAIKDSFKDDDGERGLLRSEICVAEVPKEECFELVYLTVDLENSDIYWHGASSTSNDYGLLDVLRWRIIENAELEEKKNEQG